MFELRRSLIRTERDALIPAWHLITYGLFVLGALAAGQLAGMALFGAPVWLIASACPQAIAWWAPTCW